MSATRYCAYCKCHKPDEGFTFVLHAASKSKRAQCSSCRARRKLPREKLEAMAREEAEARRQQASVIATQALERKRKNGP
jgi:hypothetical protein